MCKVTASMIIADGAAVGQALENLAVAVQATDPSLASQLQSAGSAVINATQNWKNGDNLTLVEDAEQAAIAVLNIIPATAPYAALVAIAFTALNLLIANAQTQSTQTGNAVADAHVLLSHAKTINTDSPWFGKAVIKHHILRSPRKDFEAAWNEKAAALGVADISL